MIGQLALMGMVNVMAGAQAGIGSSLFVDEGRLRWPLFPGALRIDHPRRFVDRILWHNNCRVYHKAGAEMGMGY
jgi:hypothetical protein